MIKNYLIKSMIILFAAITLFLILDQKVDERILTIQTLNQNKDI
tara:strand:+ start:607 stop:738 length:132 start_codon:yes stop_codon:yes gene_type:complete